MIELSLGMFLVLCPGYLSSCSLTEVCDVVWKKVSCLEMCYNLYIKLINDPTSRN